jgi:cell division protein FtsB
MAEREIRRHPRMARNLAAQARKKRRSKAAARHPASNVPRNKRPPSPKVRRRRATLTTVLGALAVIAFLFAFVYPTSTFFRQRSEMSKGEERLERLESETKRLEEQSKNLETDAEIERLAREQYGLVRPGETPYAFVPQAPTTTTTTPPAAKP